MDEDNKVIAEVRNTFGKGASRRARAAGRIPAVIYGHGIDPEHVTLPAHQMGLLLRKANALLNIEIAGKKQLVLVKDVQKDPFLQIIEHIDLLAVRRGEKVHVEVPVHTDGESFSGTIVELDLKTLSLEAEATHIPETIVVSVAGLTDGTQIFARDIALPKGSTLITDPELLVISVHTPTASKADVQADAIQAESAASATVVDSAKE